MQAFTEKLIKKYNQAVPRYTSYPTVPFWQDKIDKNDWASNVKQRFQAINQKGGISLYIHLPFCESLCTYCGCNKRITTNHSVEDVYINALEKEWKLYRQLMDSKPILRELHLGGGTPTFFAPENLERLLQIFLNDCTLHEDYAFSIEGHPNNTTKAHLASLQKLGFKRISYGVQDLDERVQIVINRIQPASVVQQATLDARALGFESVNFDLIYGLPLQTRESIRHTIEEVIKLKPDRIAFYSYAHVPWTSKAQRLFDESDLPSPEEKLALYLLGRKLLMQHGYVDIGMDHFALPEDELYIAHREGRLHRNFMGYTIQDAEMLIGLGVSSISDTGTAFAQNEKTLHEYYAKINEGALAVNRGFFLNDEDVRFRKYIKEIACKGHTFFDVQDEALISELCLPHLSEPIADGLVDATALELQLKENGALFLRNICSAFDLYLHRQEGTEKKQFSKAI